MTTRATEAVRRELVELWGRLGPFWGVPPATARVYAQLLSVAEADGEALAEALSTSRGAVSMACKELCDWGLVHATRPPGSRRVLYRVEDDPEKAVRGIVSTRKRREWDPILERVRAWRESLEGERSAEAVRLRERLSEIEGLVGLVDSMADAFLRGDVLPRLGLKALVATVRKRGRAKARKR